MILVLEDVAVVHVAAGEGGEAHDDVDDLVGVDSHRVLEASFVVVERVGDAVVGRLSDAYGRTGRSGRDRGGVDLHDDGNAVEDLEGVEVDVDRVGVLGQVDEPPDLGLVEHGEERGGILEAGGDGAPARDALRTVRSRFHERDEGLVRARVGRQLPHGQHGRPARDRGLLFHEGDRTDDGTGQLGAARSPNVGG